MGRWLGFLLGVVIIISGKKSGRPARLHAPAPVRQNGGCGTMDPLARPEEGFRLMESVQRAGGSGNCINNKLPGRGRQVFHYNLMKPGSMPGRASHIRATLAAAQLSPALGGRRLAPAKKAEITGWNGARATQSRPGSTALSASMFGRAGRDILLRATS